MDTKNLSNNVNVLESNKTMENMVVDFDALNEELMPGIAPEAYSFTIITDQEKMY